MGKDVFISYSRKDSVMAERFTKALDNVGISYFFDKEGISGGERFVNVIAKHILACKAFLFIGSANSYESKWTMKEITFAIQEKAPECILPVLIDDEPVPDNLRFLFSDINVISLTGQAISDTIEALRSILGKGMPFKNYVTDLIKKWKEQPQDIIESVLPEKISECFESLERFDLLQTSYYKECLSSFAIPFEVVLPDAHWSDNYDWKMLVQLVTASFTDCTVHLVDYTLRIDKSWKVNPQNDVRVHLFIDHLDGRLVGKNLDNMTESQIANLQEIVLKEQLDSLIRWETGLKQDVENEYHTAMEKMKKEISIIEKAVFLERTKNYDDIGSFHEERAKVYKDYEIGFIDPSGKLVTPVTWEDAGDFSEGLACVAEPESGYYGYIDKNGNEVIPFEWFAARPFVDGKAQVADEDDHWFLIDKKGKILND